MSLSKWATRDLTQETGAPQPVAGSAIAAMPIGDGAPRVYCAANDGDIHELSWEGSGWATRDVTLSTYV